MIMLQEDLVLDRCGRAGLCGGRRRTILKQGHGVRGVAQRRSLNLEHQLVDSEASVAPQLLSGSGHWNHLQQKSASNKSPGELEK